MDKGSFLNHDTWIGSFYELAIPIYHGELTPRDQLPRATRALWKSLGLTGPWLDKDDFPDPNKLADPFQHPSGYGILTLSEGQTLGCLTAVVEESDCDWLCLCLPMGMLEAAFPVKYPLDPNNNPWLACVDHALVCIAEAVYREVRFDLGILGEEVSGYTDRKSFHIAYLERGGYLLSPQFCQQVAGAVLGNALSSGLRWFPFPEPRVPQV